MTTNQGLSPLNTWETDRLMGLAQYFYELDDPGVQEELNRINAELNRRWLIGQFNES
jgi:hypothetical protein